ncbi:MAG TPA: DMT family transporter [Myxococcota bacterium]|nr:DMT family transporter [Myxococcota bacterium]
MSRIRIGALLGVGSSIAFTVMVTLVKICREELDALEIIHWRCVVAVPLALALAWRGGLRLQNRRVFGLRLVLGLTAMVCFFTAAKGLPLANLALISRLQPSLVAIFAPIFLGERSGKLVWGVMACGLAGCGLLIWPEFEGGLSEGGVYALWALGAAVFSTGAHMALRRLGRTDTPATIVFWFQLGVFVLAGAFLAATGSWRVPPAEYWLAIGGVGFFATIGQVAMTAAYRAEKASLVAATSYTSPLWAALVDVAIFAIVPGWEVLVGGVLVIGAGGALVFKGPASQRPTG